MTPPLPFSTASAVTFLRQVDPLLASVIARVGPVHEEASAEETPDLFQALVRSIIYQQLHAKAASAIHQRVLAAVPEKTPLLTALQQLPDEPLREAGLSANKLRALRDLAAKTEAEIVPTFSQAKLLTDAELVSRLTQVRGIGPWTVQMLLIFTLGRPDVFPLGDFAICQNMQQLYGQGKGSSSVLTKKELSVIADKWSPHRTTASWYIWQAS